MQRHIKAVLFAVGILTAASLPASADRSYWYDTQQNQHDSQGWNYSYGGYSGGGYNPYGTFGQHHGFNNSFDHGFDHDGWNNGGFHHGGGGFNNGFHGGGGMHGGGGFHGGGGMHGGGGFHGGGHH